MSERDRSWNEKSNYGGDRSKLEPVSKDYLLAGDGCDDAEATHGQAASTDRSGTRAEGLGQGRGPPLSRLRQEVPVPLGAGDPHGHPTHGHRPGKALG